MSDSGYMLGGEPKVFEDRKDGGGVIKIIKEDSKDFWLE